VRESSYLYCEVMERQLALGGVAGTWRVARTVVRDQVGGVVLERAFFHVVTRSSTKLLTNQTGPIKIDLKEPFEPRAG
jgi:hypothetical protein